MFPAAGAGVGDASFAGPFKPAAAGAAAPGVGYAGEACGETPPTRKK